MNENPNQTPQQPVSSQPAPTVQQKKTKFRKPVAGAIGWMLLIFLIVNVLTLPVAFFDPLLRNEKSMMAVSLITAIGGILSLFIFHICYKRDGFRNFITNGSFKLAALLIIPALLYNLSGLFFATTFPTLRSSILSLQAGFFEETMFRAVPIAYLMRAYKFNEKKITFSVILTSILFGLIHATNMLMGAPLGATIYQVVCATGIGIFFGAVYMRTGNILWCIFSHILQDFLAFLNEAAVNESGVMKEITFTPDVIWDILIMAVFTVLGLYYIRKSKRGEITERWKKIWSYTEETQPVQTENA